MPENAFADLIPNNAETQSGNAFADLIPQPKPLGKSNIPGSLEALGKVKDTFYNKYGNELRIEQWADRDIRGRPGKKSMHATGEALDIFQVGPEALAVAQSDPNIGYIIHNRQQYKRQPDGSWKVSKYTGVNPHTDHMHVQAYNGPVRQQSPKPSSVVTTGSVAASASANTAKAIKQMVQSSAPPEPRSIVDLLLPPKVTTQTTIPGSGVSPKPKPGLMGAVEAANKTREQGAALNQRDRSEKARRAGEAVGMIEAQQNSPLGRAKRLGGKEYLNLAKSNPDQFESLAKQLDREPQFWYESLSIGDKDPILQWGKRAGIKNADVRRMVMESGYQNIQNMLSEKLGDPSVRAQLVPTPKFKRLYDDPSYFMEKSNKIGDQFKDLLTDNPVTETLAAITAPLDPTHLIGREKGLVGDIAGLIGGVGQMGLAAPAEVATFYHPNASAGQRLGAITNLAMTIGIFDPLDVAKPVLRVLNPKKLVNALVERGLNRQDAYQYVAKTIAESKKVPELATATVEQVVPPTVEVPTVRESGNGVPNPKSPVDQGETYTPPPRTEGAKPTPLELPNYEGGTAPDLKQGLKGEAVSDVPKGTRTKRRIAIGGTDYDTGGAKMEMVLSEPVDVGAPSGLYYYVGKRSGDGTASQAKGADFRVRSVSIGGGGTPRSVRA